MNNVYITFENGETKTFSDGVSYYDIVSSMGLEKEVIGVIVNDKVANLGDKPQGRVSIKYVYKNSTNGRRMYEAGLKMIFECAVHDVFPNITVKYSYDCPHGLIARFITDHIVSKEDFAKIEKEVNRIVSQDEVIKKKYLKNADGIKYHKLNNNIVKLKNIQNITDSMIVMYKLEELTNYYYYEMPHRTGIISQYNIYYVGENIIFLNYPTVYDDKLIITEANYRKIFSAYQWGERWLDVQKLPYINDVNDLVSSGQIREFIKTCELKFNAEIERCAEDIYNNPQVKFILLAGPSSSGKTTCTKRLASYLKVFGKKPVVVSIDDYYKERVDTPKDENGKYDFECPEATDTEYFLSDMQKLLNGEEIQLPIFNFVTGCKELKGPKIKLDDDSILLFEGINALHPSVLTSIDDAKKYYIYVSPYIPLCIDQQNYISTEDLRLIRRIVRDFRTRGYSVESSLESWGRVRAGEEKHILPQIHRANKVINTSLAYEVGALKVLASPLLLSVPSSSEWYGEARRLSSFLKQFFTINCEYVPEDSIIREFIGGKND